jgi:hypothetical protein
MAEFMADAAAAARNQRQFVGALTKLADGWRQESLITRAQKDAIISAAAE